MNEKIISAADMMLQAANLGTSSADKIYTVWKKVVSGVHSFKHESEDSDKRMSLGERLAGNTRVVDFKNGVLLVETDHSGWIQYLRMYQKFILNGLKMNLPELKITNLAFRVTGEKVSLSETYEQQLKKSREEMAKKFEEEEKKLSDYEKQISKKFSSAASSGNNSNKQSSLPEDLLAKFDNIRKSIASETDKSSPLTNSLNK